MGRAEESRGLLAHPESMGGPPAMDDEYADITPAWRDRVRRRLPYLNWRNCRYVSVCLVLLLITVGFLMNAITSVIVDDDVSDSYLFTHIYIILLSTAIYLSGKHLH
jgi:hypothetical protein